MHPNAALIERFYAAFQAHDAEAMAACYAPDARFHDPVFLDLKGDEVRAMWRMLLGRAADLEVTFSQVQADDDQGSAHWEATYTFSATGRRVHNVIDARFELAGGLITSHRDTFDLYRWTRMALGPSGILLGWSGLVQNKVRGQARKGLDQFMRKAST